MSALDIAVLLLSDDRRTPPEKRQLSEIASTLLAFRSNITRSAEKLEHLDYAERVRHPDDGRRFILRATPVGRDLIDEIEAKRPASDRRPRREAA